MSLALITQSAVGLRLAVAEEADQKPGESTRINVEWSILSAPASEQWIAADWNNSSKPLLGAIGAKHIVVWDLTTQETIFTVPHGVRLHPHWSPRIRIRLSPDGREVAAAIPDEGATLRRWDIAKAAALEDVPIVGLNFADFAFSKDSNQIIVLGSNGRLFTYDTMTRKRGPVILQDAVNYDHARLSMMGPPVVVVHRKLRDRQVLMWDGDLRNPKQLANYPDFGSFDSFVVGPRGDMFVGSFKDVRSNPWIYPITYHNPLAEARTLTGLGTRSAIVDIAVAPHGCFFLLVTRDGRMTFWDTIENCGVVHTQFDSEVPLRATVSPDSRQVAVLFAGGRVMVSNISSWFSQEQVGVKSLNLLLRDLGSANVIEANQAFFALVREGDASVKAQSNYLLHVASEANDCKGLVSKLTSDDFATRESAEAILRDMGESAVADLKQQSNDHSSAEARWRLDRIVQALEKAPLSPRMKRMIAIMQSIATSDAAALVRTLQTHPSRAIRMEATRACEWLSGRYASPEQRGLK